MCWIGDNIKQIAEENIPVFKICTVKDSVIKSFYQNFEYKLGTEYTSKIVIKDSFRGLKRIDKGLHSYHHKVSIEELPKGIICRGLNARQVEAHFYDEVPEHIAKVVGLIPKSSVYYLNDKGEYVSDKLVLTKIARIYDYRRICLI